jgi:hypothetical protein
MIHTCAKMEVLGQRDWVFQAEIVNRKKLYEAYKIMAKVYYSNLAEQDKKKLMIITEEKLIKNTGMQIAEI